MNLKHNCYPGQCKVTKTKAVHVKRQDTMVRRYEVTHSESTRFILNSASFHAPEEHRRIAGLPLIAISPSELVDGMDEGFQIWSDSSN